MSALSKTLAKALPTRDSPKSSKPSTPTTDSESDLEELSSSSDKYRLRVTAGSSYDPAKQSTVLVNGREDFCVENEFLRARIKVRVRDYTGLPSGSPTTSPYFSHPAHTKDQYSISFSFIPKVDIPSTDTVWGNDFDNAIRDRLPPGFNTAFKIVKQFIDPGLECDPYADKPWLLGPSLSCWFQFRVGDKGNVRDPHLDDIVNEGADGSGKDVRQSKHVPDDSEKRRKYFLDAAHRQDFVFEKGRQYQADFHNPYINFNKVSLKLPGFSIRVGRFINDKTHKLRYVFKNKATGDVYLVVVFMLLYDQELKDAMAADKTTERMRKQYQEDFGGVD